MSVWKRTMDYLGLGPDDAYDDYDEVDEYDDRQTRRAQPAPDDRPTHAAPDEGDPSVRTIQTRPSYPSRDFDSGRHSSPPPPPDEAQVQTRGDRPSQPSQPGGRSVSSSVTLASGEPYTVHPHRFDQAQEVADKFKEGQPVIMNLEGTDREVSRRLIDFASGLCYALDGSMEKVATGVYLLKPPAIRFQRDS